MAITLRSSREIELMHEAGVIVADVLLKLKEIVEPGVSTACLDSVAERMALDAGAEVLFKGVRGAQSQKPFPGVICASINEQVVHGIPSEKIKLCDGDIVSVDFGVRLAGYCGDGAVTIAVGEISDENHRLIEATEKALAIAVKYAAPGIKWSLIAAKMQACAESAGFSVVTEYVGHGIGRQMHEEPRVPNFVSDELRAYDIVLKEGMVLAVEPMINSGTAGTKVLNDGWTVVTKDGKSSAHFEHTIAIVKNGCRVLTVK